MIFLDKIINFVKNHKLKIFLSLIFLIWSLFVGVKFVSAQPTTSVDDNGVSLLLQIYTMMKIVIQLLSRLRVLLATIAWKLMTNSLATWEWFGITEVLYGYNKYIQSFTRLILVFIILKSIVQNAIIKYDLKKLQSLWISTIFASIGIMISWRFVSFLISVSNIMFLAISDLWTNLIMSTSMDTLKQVNISIPKVINTDLSKSNKNVTTWLENYSNSNMNVIDSLCFLYSTTQNTSSTNSNDYYEGDILKLLPKADDISWPLMYFGFWIFKFQSYVQDSPFSTLNFSATDYCTNDGKSIANLDKEITDKLSQQLNGQFKTRLSDMILSLLVLFINISFFSVAIVTLLVINFLRMFFIRMIFVFSPLIALSWAFSSDLKYINESLWKIGANSLSSLVALIFQPMISMFWIVLAMFFVNSMYNSFTQLQTEWQKQTAQTLYNVKDNNNTSFVRFDEWSEFNINGSFINDATGAVWWWIWYIFMSIITLYILWMIIRVSGSFSKAVGKYTDDIMSKSSDFLFDNIKTPFFGGASLWALTGFGWTSSKNLKDTFMDPYNENIKRKIARDADQVSDYIGGITGTNTPDISNYNKLNLQMSWANKLYDGKAENKEWNKALEETFKYKSNKKDTLNGFKDDTIKFFKWIRDNLPKWEVDLSKAPNVIELLEWWMKNGWAQLMHHAYGLKIDHSKINNMQDILWLIDQKNQIWTFVNNMLWNEDYQSKFAWAKFETSWLPDKAKFSDNGTSIKDSDHKKASSVKFTKK